MRTGCRWAYRGTAPATGIYRFDLSGSESPHWADVYRGDRVGLLESVPQIGTGVFAAEGGVTYRLRVTRGYYSAPGDIELRWRSVPLPANDAFAAAQTLTGASGSVKAEPYGATRELLEPSHTYDPADGGNSVWYRWTAPADGAFAFSFKGQTHDYDAVLAVYTGTAFGNLKRVDRRGRSETLRFGTEAGRTYMIAIDSQNPFELAWTQTPAPANDLFKNAVALPAAGGTVLNDGRLASFEPGGPLAYTSAWYSWTAPADGPVTFAGGSMAAWSSTPWGRTGRASRSGAPS